MARITINGVTVDPLAQRDELAEASLIAEDASQSNYLLVQTDHVLSAEEKAQLVNVGVVIHEYVPENTYLCGYQPSDLDAVRDLPFVTWADVYLEGFKIAPSLRGEGLRPDISVLRAPADALVPGTRTVDIVLHDDVDPGSYEVRQRIAAAARLNPDDLHPARDKLRVEVPEESLAALTAMDEVRQVEEVPERSLYNSQARPILHADVVVNGTPHQGEGQVVAVADTGLDLGSTTDVHSAFTSRVARLYALGRPTRADDPDGHGTHVAGSVLGDAASAAIGGAVQGTAPRATLVLQSLLDRRGGLGGIPADLRDLFTPPYDNDGARVHTNSWGSTVPGLSYDRSAFEIDDMVWNNQDLVICFAAGNDGNDRDRDGRVNLGDVGSEGAAKNCITVGASESSRPEVRSTYGELWGRDFPVNPIRDDRQADNPDGMAAFSSRGPTREGRIAPDIVGPGTSILSALSRAAASIPGDPFGASADPKFFFLSGTSMATPLVAGCVAVLRETLIRNGTPEPSAALVKAMLINGAVELPGQYSPSEAGPSPNNNSGFGRVDLTRSVVLPGDDGRAGFHEGGPLDQGEQNLVRIRIPEQDGGEEPTFKVTLVWTDPPGAALQNDLDLVVRTADGRERHGNMGTSAGFDRTNNVEQVQWDDIPAGDVEVIVRAHRITRFPQPYAFAWRIS
ncbi:S8 family serine peptidase [Streptomyces luteolifulvus]|uniref:S8 family serine peptidase n=1 Tax=Streptomyces luteolifulvus TaxID=2615112 RepID=A0A6H9UQ15_9ACTN|nr:S8 family serine peptidase [Streptomyces luteolifulvus]KAB1140106.1 S8 family serine peptidase [Streptomyces luteolifulvus]